MKIATWNIERLRIKHNRIQIQFEIEKINADILILTEFDNLVELPLYKFKYETEELSQEPYHYRETERRVAIFSKYPIKKSFNTFDNKTSCCIEIILEKEKLIVYGTILGIIGIGDKNFYSDLDGQIEDICSFSPIDNFCFGGDLNTTFADNTYVSKKARQKLINCFEENKLVITTGNIRENVDHIILSEKFISNKKIQITTWNVEKKISDHIGICVELIN